MRVNTPITQKEFTYQDGVTLVSMTDLKGRITYANDAFVAVSGFTREELYGKPHNLIRHPDMPPEAFRDMWATLQSGSPWSALVKNRRKDGDHYWVMANATPVMNNGQPEGYMSVRTKPSRAEIQGAEDLYTRMRDEQASGRLKIGLSRGRLVKKGAAGMIDRCTRLTLGRRMALGTISLTAAVQLIEHLSEGFGMAGHYGALAGSAALALGAAWLLKRIFTAPLGETVDFANRMAAGDLTGRMPTNQPGEFGELSRALNQLNVNLQAVVSDVRREVQGVSVAASEIASGNSDLSARTESQASSLEETAASMEEITSTVQHSATSASEAAKLAERAAAVAKESNQAMQMLIGTMENIQKSSSRIGEIIQVIDGISFQTNILALNAAVEAARAGEQGRGFAVVAGEVRSLAQRTLTAASEIKGLIEESANTVAQGSTQVSEASDTIAGMLQSVLQVDALINEITSASQEQSQGLSQINEAVGHMDSVTQQNSAMVEELSAASSSLQQQARVLEETVRVFKLQSSPSSHNPTAVQTNKDAQAA